VTLTSPRPGSTLRPETFFEFIKAYPDWEACAIYLYRLWPVIDRKLTGHSEKYIDVFSEPISEMDILRKHGSGKYLLHFNDSNRPGGLKQVAMCKLELNDPLYDPILDQNEVVEGIDANKSYIEGLIARGKWKRNPPVEQAAAASDTLAASLATALQRISAPPAPAAPVVTAEPARPDPYEIGLRIAELAQRTAPKPSADPLELALKIVSLMHQRPAEDPLELYGKVADIIEARAARYAGKPAGADWSTVLLDLAKALPALIQGFVAMKAAGGQAQAAAGQAPATAPPAAAVAVATPEALLEELKPFLLRAISTGQGGDEFAAGVVTFYGEDRYRQIAGLGADGILDSLRRQPEVWTVLSPYEADIRAFVLDFLAYGNPTEETTVQ
jgi:hypothetical protein